jgi:hypothetical protein
VKMADRVSAVALLALCVWLMLLSRRFSPYSALFPRTIIVILAALSVILLVMSFVKPKEGRVFEGMRRSAVPIGVATGLMIVWLVFMDVIGFLVSSLVFFGLMTLFLSRKRNAGALIGNVAIVWALTVGFYLFFAILLMVPFPTGLLL